MVDKIRMWREELERQNASMGVKAVFDSMLIFMGEQQREIEQQQEEINKLQKMREIVSEAHQNNLQEKDKEIERLKDIQSQNKSIVEEIIGEETLWQNGEYESEMMKLRKENERYKETLYALLKGSHDTDQCVFIDIITDALSGEELYEQYEEEAVEGRHIMAQILHDRSS